MVESFISLTAKTPSIKTVERIAVKRTASVFLQRYFLFQFYSYIWFTYYKLLLKQFNHFNSNHFISSHPIQACALRLALRNFCVVFGGDIVGRIKKREKLSLSELIFGGYVS
jgi:hypothetical protein